LAILKGHTDDITAVCFSFDSKYLASVSKDCSLRVYHTSDLKSEKTPVGIKISTGADYANSVCFSSDNQHIVVGLNNNDIVAFRLFEKANESQKHPTLSYKEVFKFNTNKSLSNEQKQKYPINNALISNNSKFLVSCSGYKYVFTLLK